MYGYLTLENCDCLYEQGYCSICDGDIKEIIIKDNEKEYAQYLIENTNIIKTITNIFDSLCDAFKTIFIGIGKAFIKMGGGE